MLALLLFLAQPPYEEALRDYRADRFAEAELKLRRISPRSFEARFLLGATLVQLGRGEEAVAELRAAVAQNPGHADAVKLLGTELLKASRFGETIALLRPRIARHARDHEMHLLLLEALHRRGDSGDAEAALDLARSALARFPNSAQIHSWMGVELRDAGQLDEARRHLERALTLDTSEVQARIVLADVYSRKGEHEEARRRFETLARELPGDSEVQLGLARSLVGLGRLEEARGYLDALIKAEPENAQAHFDLSRLYARMGDAERARLHGEEFRKLRQARRPPVR